MQQHLQAQCGSISNIVPTASAYNICSGTSIDIRADGLPIQRWIYRNNFSGPWIAINTAGNLMNEWIASSSNTTRTYRAVVTTTTCTDTTAGVNIQINQQNFGNNNQIKLAASALTACSGTSVTIRLMNEGVTVTQWLYRSSTSSAWGILSNGSGYSAVIKLPSVATPTSWQFRTLSRTNSCREDSSDILTVQVLPAINGTNTAVMPVANVSEMCATGVVNLNVDWEHETGDWLYCDATGNWQVAAQGSNNLSHFVNPTTALTNREYRVILNNPYTCTSDTSASAFITIKPLVGNIVPSIRPRFIGNAREVCAGANMAFSMQGFNNILTWQFRDSVTGTWINFGGSNSSVSLPSVAAFSSPINRAVRVILNNAAMHCSMDTSQEIVYTIRPNTRGNNNNILPNTAFSELCLGALAEIQLPVGNTISGWIYRDNIVGNWQLVNTQTNRFLDNVAESSIPVLRTYRALVLNSANCATDTTAGVDVLFKVPSPGTTIPVTPIIHQTKYCAGNTITGELQEVATNPLMPLHWIYRDNDTAWWEIVAGSNGSKFWDDNTSNVQTTTRRKYRLVVRNLERMSIDTTLQAQTIIQPVVYGNVSIQPFMSGNNVCRDTYASIQIVQPAGYSIKSWMRRDTTTQPWSIFFPLSPTNTDFVNTNFHSRSYRLLLQQQESCLVDTTDALTIQVQQKTGRINNGYKPNINVASVCAGKSGVALTLNLTPGVTVTRWQSRDNNAAWQDVPGQSSAPSYIEPATNTRVLATTIRDYRAVLIDNNNCSFDTTDFASVRLDAWMHGQVTDVNPTTNNPTICAGTQAFFNISLLGSVQKWMYKDVNGPWQDVPGNSNSLSYTQPPFLSHLENATTRNYRVVFERPGTCFIDTSASLSIQVLPATFGNVHTIQPASAVQQVCNGIPFFVQIPASTNYTVHKWITRDQVNGPWLEIPTSSASFGFTDYRVQVPQNTTRQLRAIIQTQSCSYDTTAAVQVQIKTRIAGNANAVLVSTNATSYCVGENISAGVINNTLPPNTSVQRWLYRDQTNGRWVQMLASSSNFMSQNNVQVQQTTTRFFRVILNNNNNCTADTSAAVSVLIRPNGLGFAGGITPTVSSGAVCDASVFPVLFANVPSGYNMLYWMMNDNGTGWKKFPYNAAASSVTDYHVNVNTTVNRTYRVVVANNYNCTIDSSQTTGITIQPRALGSNPGLVPVVSNNSHVLCYGKPIGVSIQASGYTVIKWIYEDNASGKWNDFSFPTQTTLLTDAHTWVAQTTIRSYKAILNHVTNCRQDTSASVSVIIQPRSARIGNSNLQPTTAWPFICSGSTASLSIETGPAAEVIGWIYSDQGNAGPWQQVSIGVNATDLSNIVHHQTHVSTLINRQYRAIITDTTTCGLDTSAGASVIIRAIGYGTDFNIQVSGADSICAGSVLLLNVTPGNGNNVHNWLVKKDSGNWQTFSSNRISNPTLLDSQTPLVALASSTYTPIVFKSATCSYDTVFASKKVVFKAKSYSNSSATVIALADTICVGSPISIRTSGTVERWLYRDGKFGNWNIVPIANDTLMHSETLVTASTWRYYRAIRGSGNCTADTTEADSVFIKHTTWGNIASQPTATPTNACEGVAINLVSPANQSRWLYRDGLSGNWNTLVNEPIKVVNDYQTIINATTTRYYRFIAISACSFDTSEAVSVVINKKLRGRDNTRTPTTSTNNVCSGNPVQNLFVNTSGVFIVQWIFRDNNGVWKVHNTGNQNNIADFNTFVQQPTIRQYAALINNNLSCRIDTTNSVTVNILPVLNGNSNRTPIIQGTGCMGNTYNVSMSVGVDTNIVGIIYNTNGGNWMQAGHVNPFSSVNISQFGYSASNPYTVLYRALLFKRSTCKLDTSASTMIVINSKNYGNDQAIIPTGPSSACANTNIELSANAGAGNTVFDWIFKEANGPWTRMFVSSSIFNHQVNTTSLSVRQYRALIAKGNNCSIDTTAPLNITINPIVYGYDNSVSISVDSPKNFCTGNSFTIATNPVNVPVQTWLYRDNFGRWNNLFQNTNTITDFNTQSTSFLQRSYAAVIWKPTTCAIDTTTLTDNATISNRTFGSDTSITISSLFTSICGGSGVNLIATNINTHSVHGWLFRNNNGLWTSLTPQQTPSVNDFNTNVSALVQRDYAVLVRKSNLCRIDTGVVRSIFIFPRNRGTDQTIIPVSNSNNICAGSAINVNVNPGANNTIIKWIVRNNNGPFVDFASTSSNTIQDNNTQTTISISRQYRAIIAKANSCLTDTSAGVTVTINPIVFGNQQNIQPVVTENAICGGSPNLVSVSGYNGNGVLWWIYRNNGGAWIPINQAAATISDNQTMVSIFTNREYRALINNTSACRLDTTSARAVTINPFTFGNMVATTQAINTSICSGTPLQLFVNPISGYGVQRWLVNEGAGWQTLSNSQAFSLNMGNTQVANTTNRQYRALMRNLVSCAMDSTVALSIQMSPYTNGVNLTLQPTTPTPVLCSGKKALVLLQNQQIIHWLYRDSISDFWKMIPTNGALLSHQVNTTHEHTRQYRAIVFNASNCSFDSTALVGVNVKPILQSNAQAIAPIAAKQSICSGSAINLSSTGFINGGVVVGWLYSDNNGAWNAINVVGSVLNHTATIVQSQTIRKYRALVVTGCQTDTTDAVTVTIDIEPTKPIVVANGNVLTCSEVAASYQWKRNGVNVSGATAKTHQASMSGDYTVEIANATGCVNISEAFPFVFQNVREVLVQLKANIYPNPNSNGRYYIEMDGIKQGIAKYTIVSITGKTIQQGIIEHPTKPYMLDISMEHSGVYFVTIVYGDKTMTKRLVFAK
jgi:hypothetical protein